MGRKTKVEIDNKGQSIVFLKVAKKIQTGDAKQRFEKACDILFKKKEKPNSSKIGC